MKNNLIKIFLIALLLPVSWSCDDYLDIDPYYAQDADNFFNAREDYERALTGAYDLLQTSWMDLWIGEIATANSIAGGESPFDTEGLHNIDDMIHGGVNNEMRNVWRWNYAGVTRANYLLEFKDKIDFEGKDEIIAQARFLRAYYYFQLVKYFGDVPLVVGKRLGFEEVRSFPRTPKAEVYAQIEEDLQAAADVLDWQVAEKGRITKGSALAMLGKVYLYQDKFSQAATVLDQVIDEGPYGLLEDFENMFRVENENSEENVFSIEFTGLEGGGYGCFVCLEGNPAVGFHSIRGYEGPIYVDGNSYNLPTQDLVDAFETGDPRLPVAILDIEAFAAENEGVSYVEGGGGHTGYYNNKYIKRADELGLPDTDLTSPVNYRVIRYADVLLMAAEAHARKANPDESKAQNYLNQVRLRVDLEGVTATGQALLDAIYHERRVELAGEGLHFWDLVRTGRAANEIDGFIVGTHEVFPIPQDEIDLAGGNWDQNNGYN